MLEQILPYWNTTVELVGPNPYLQAGLIVVLSVVASSIVQRIIARVCRRLAARSATDLDDRFLALIERPVYLTVLLAGLAVASLRLPLSETVEFATLGVLKSIGIVVWMGFALRMSTQILDLFARMPNRYRFIDGRTRPLIGNIAVLLVGIAGIYAFMSAWGINVTALLASAGIVGLALSFAAKDTLSNVFAGVSILVDVPYKVGDYIVVESGERGVVTNIGLRSSRLLTRDDVEITIPNAVIGNAKIVNESGGPYEKFRIRAKTSVAYGSDLEAVCALLERIANDHDEVCSTPAPRVRVRGFGDFGIDIELLAWVDAPVHRGRMLHELYLIIYRRFGEEGVEIPYPKHEIFVQSLPEQADD